MTDERSERLMRRWFGAHLVPPDPYYGQRLRSTIIGQGIITELGHLGIRARDAGDNFVSVDTREDAQVASMLLQAMYGKQPRITDYLDGGDPSELENGSARFGVSVYIDR